MLNAYHRTLRIAFNSSNSISVCTLPKCSVSELEECCSSLTLCGKVDRQQGGQDLAKMLPCVQALGLEALQTHQSQATPL